jgi:glutathione peroxidase
MNLPGKRKVFAMAVLSLFLPWTGISADGGVMVLSHTMKDIDGNDVDLAKFKGQVVMMVNVASKCGYTGQYKDLQTIYEKFKDRGFVILGFPANNFLWQEPGTNEEIKQFCTRKYSVTFPMFAKISVKGKDKAPLYQDLTSKEKNGKFGGEIGWNFTKFLVGRDGTIMARFDSGTNPSEPQVLQAIETALSVK